MGDDCSPWGDVIMDLGKVEQELEASPSHPRRQTLLLRLLIFSDDLNLTEKDAQRLTLAQQKVKKLQMALLRPMGRDLRLESVRQELALTTELMTLACKLGRGLALSKAGLTGLSPTLRTDLANKLLSLVEQFKAHWTVRYHPEGMRGSLLAMNNLLVNIMPTTSTNK